MKTILITAVGSMAARPVIGRFHQLGYQVISCDIYAREWNAASIEADAFFQSLLSTEGEAYAAQMLDAVARYSADYLIPLTDPETDVLSPLKSAFAERGCVLCAPDEKVTRLCRAKDEMTRFLAGAEACRLIPTFDPYAQEPEAFPIMLKPQRGRSSQGQMIVHTPKDYRAALLTRTDFIAQPFLPGPIWTADVARDRFGNVQTAVRQELLRNPSGLGMTVKVVPNHPLGAVCAKIADAAGIVGVVNMEFIEHDNQFWFLEVNPRFSGGVGFSLMAGVDFASLMLLCHAGEAIGPQPGVRAATIARMSEMMITDE